MTTKEKKYSINNLSDYQVRLIGWSLARQGRMIEACSVFYYTFGYTLSHARAYTKHLKELTSYENVNQKQDIELGYL